MLLKILTAFRVVPSPTERFEPTVLAKSIASLIGIIDKIVLKLFASFFGAI